MSPTSEDTPPTTTSAPPPSKPKRYFEPPLDHPANDLSHTAVPGFTDAVKSIKLDDFKTVHHNPCFREANLNGMGAGFAIGGLRFIVGGTVMKACNWAVGGFMLTAIGSYEYCVVRRRIEKEGMRRATAILEAKRLAKEQKAAEKRELAVKAASEREEKEAAATTSKSFWKLW